MQSSASPFLIILVLVGVLGVMAVVVGFTMRPARPSRALTIAAILPAFIMLSLFYSLAIHMRNSLGGWPTSIGNEGFPGALVVHDHIAETCFVALFLTSIFAWPVAFLLCTFVRRWRVGTFYLGIYALSCFICYGLMLLAPAEFLDWWWD